MPFDFESLLREHRVHTEPPQQPPEPPERGGAGPRRIRIEIEIVDRRPRPKPRSRHGFWWLVLGLILLAALAGCAAVAQ